MDRICFWCKWWWGKDGKNDESGKCVQDGAKTTLGSDRCCDWEDAYEYPGAEDNE